MIDFQLDSERYKLVRELGRGAFATVYLADDLKMKRPVAIKVVEQHSDMDERVVREAQAASKLSHPHIVTLYEMERGPERTLLFTEYVEGETLRNRYRERTLLDREILEAGVQLCKALDHAHKRGVVHRDIKPENIMLVACDDVDVRLMDFGVAQLDDRSSITMDGDLIGTLAYMSPEQVEGQNVDSRSDVYSLAVTLYEGFTRQNPLKGKKFQELLRDVSRPDIPPLCTVRPELPQRLSDALEQAMRQNRHARPDASVLGRRLNDALREMPVEIPEENMATRIMHRLEPVGISRDRAAYLGQHLTCGVSSLLTLLYALMRVPFYPSAWLVPMVAISAFVSLLWPLAGTVLTLLLLAPPIFAFSVGWGVIYLILAVLSLFLLRRKDLTWAVLLPGVMPFAILGGVGMAMMPFVGVAMRRWGALTGFLCGLSLSVTAGLAGWTRLPYTYNLAPAANLTSTESVASPWNALIGLARFLDSRPELSLQILLFTVFSLPLAGLLSSALRSRSWGVNLYLMLLFAAFVALPILALGAPVNIGRFVVAYAPCAIIAYLCTLLMPSAGPKS